MFRMGIMSVAPALVLATAAAAGPARHEPPRLSAYGPFTLKVEIEGVTQGVFRSIEGLASESEVLTGEENGTQALIPGSAKGARIVLHRPYDPGLSGLWRWRQSVIDGDPQRRDGHIFVFDAAGNLAAHWVFHKGWPNRWEVPRLASGSDEPAEEVVEIVHAGLTLEASAGL